jgi:hypothetical protein
MSHCWLLRLDIAQSGAPNEQVRPSFRVDMLRDAERVPGAFQQTMPQGPVKKWDVQVNAAKGGTLAERSYDDLLQADFVSTHQATGKHVYFAILLGTRGSMKGVPVQIRYQPNWRFQVVLNLISQKRSQ